MNIKIEQSRPFPIGVTFSDNAIDIKMIYEGANHPGIALRRYHDQEEKTLKIQFPAEYRSGKIFHMKLSGFSYPEIKKIKTSITNQRDLMQTYSAGTSSIMQRDDLIEYYFYDEEFKWKDPYAKLILEDKCFISLCNIPTKKAKNPVIHIEETILYCVHPKGFTADPDSNVLHPGTFEGINEKITYLKNLGINTLELMPVYSFDSYDRHSESEMTIEEALHSYHLPMEHMGINKKGTVSQRKNYWGFKEAFHFSVNYEYCSTNDPISEFRELVDKLHNNQMQIILQFYFKAPSINHYVIDVLRYWKTFFGVDGFHLKGEDLPIKMILEDPLLWDCKIFYESDSNIPKEESYRKRFAVYNDRYMNTIRRFLKGDENQIPESVDLILENREFYTYVHYLSNYNEFTLKDMVTYNYKHNELNGEDNRDGKEINYSWNCGIEGDTKNSKILNLRKKMVRNAVLMLLTSQGIPMIYGGDEFLNSQNGNNNPYCQDNEISWMNWSNKNKNRSFAKFFRDILKFRCEEKVFSQGKQLRLLDYRATGYPDVSIHKRIPWNPDRLMEERHFAFLYDASYCDNKKNHFFYIFYNMEWEEKEIYLPRLPIGYQWTLAYKTCKKSDLPIKIKEMDRFGFKQESMTIEERSILIMKGIKCS